MKQRYLKQILVCSLLIPMLNFANETEETPKTDTPTATRIVVGNRPIEQIKETEEGSAQFFGGDYPVLYYPAGVHYIDRFSALGNTVDMEDGAVWKISRYDAPKVLTWSGDHPIMITQNHRWFSQYNYRIINQATGESLEANLYLGPFHNGPYTRYIVSIDLYHGCAILNDGTHWKVSPYDAYLFDQWRLHDTVIIGYNSGYDSSYQGLLINVNMNCSVRAEQF